MSRNWPTIILPFWLTALLVTGALVIVSYDVRAAIAFGVLGLMPVAFCLVAGIFMLWVDAIKEMRK